MEISTQPLIYQIRLLHLLNYGSHYLVLAAFIVCNRIPDATELVLYICHSANIRNSCRM